MVETITGMKRNAKMFGYDLDKIEEVEEFRPPAQTDGADQAEEDQDTPFVDEPDKKYTLYERHGIFPAVIEEVDNDGYPTRIKPGYDEHGDEHGEYDLAAFRLAVIGGVHPDGESLSRDMPRWRMDDRDLADLFDFLETLR